MRVSAETKETTRRRILEQAESLFRRVGFEATTTRDIAEAAGIAAGTLFNYFPTKESLVASLVAEALTRRGTPQRADVGETLEEALFSHAAASLRALKPYRKYLGPVLELSLSPLNASSDSSAATMRTEHLETVLDSARRFDLHGRLDALGLHLYWTLYLGVLSFWLQDKSPKQEDTLALLDQSLEMFVGWLASDE